MDPVHAPEAEHAVVSVLAQDKVDEAPSVRLVGEAVSVSVGAGGDATVTLTVLDTEPPLPVHARV